jgi:hypothetical protein
MGLRLDKRATWSARAAHPLAGVVPRRLVVPASIVRRDPLQPTAVYQPLPGSAAGALRRRRVSAPAHSRTLGQPREANNRRRRGDEPVQIHQLISRHTIYLDCLKTQ